MLRCFAIVVTAASFLLGAQAVLAATSCQPEIAATPTPVQPNPTATRQNECRYLSADQIAAIVPHAHIVDARSVVKTQGVRIPEALSVDTMPVGANGDTVVIVGSGYDSEADRRACAHLADKGYTNVQILRGGVRAWARAGLALWSDARGIDALDELAPADAHAAAVRGDARLVILPAGELPILCPQAVANIHCVASIAQAKAQIDQCESTELIIIAASDEDRARIAPAALPAESNALRVAGGSEAMRRHFEQFRSIALSANQPLWIPCHRR